METRSRFTLFLIFVAALTAATALQTPVAQTQTTQADRIAHELINMRVGYVQMWTAPRPFVDVHVGKPEIADVTTGKTDRQLIINSKAPQLDQSLEMNALFRFLGADFICPLSPSLFLPQPPSFRFSPPSRGTATTYPPFIQLQPLPVRIPRAITATILTAGAA